MDGLLDASENQGYLNSLNELKPTAEYKFGDKAKVMVSGEWEVVHVWGGGGPNIHM